MKRVKIKLVLLSGESHPTFSLALEFDWFSYLIGSFYFSLGKDGVEMMESNKITTDGFFEIKLRKSKPGLLKHYWMGKTQHCMEDYR